MKEYDDETLKKLHKVQIEILDDFVKICEKHKFSYSLVGGTLLGAIRHKGFIPWDDDIDVGLLRKDYDKFIKVAKEELGDKYYLDCFEYNKDYYLPFAKIKKNNTIFDEVFSHNFKNHKGIYIDIFPFENVGKNLKLSFLRTFIVKSIIDTMFVKNGFRELKKTRHPMVVRFFRIFSKKRLMKIQHFFLTRNKNNNSKYVAALTGYGFDKELMLREDFLPTKDVLFENKKYKSLNNYDKYLSNLYGDYMKLPPVEKRINHMPLSIVFNKEETKYDLRKLQLTLVEILDEVVRICKKHKLDYFLASGTCLGAVRHKGFIPWDDDIDIIMPREDYEKFLIVAMNDLDDKYFLDYYKTDSENHFGFAKVKKNNTSFIGGYKYKCHNGIFLDIFPMDYNYNPNTLKVKLSVRLSRCLLESLKFKDHNLSFKNLRRPFISFPCAIFSHRRLHKMIDHLFQNNNKKEHKYGAVYCNIYNYKKDIYPIDEVFPYQEITFEGKKYHVFHDTDSYLKRLYGNYLELPPKEKRITHKPEIIDFDKGDSRNTKEEYDKLNRK